MSNMPARAPAASAETLARLAALGAAVRARRKALELGVATTAEAAGMSRVTLHRIERGEPSVTMGAWMSAMAVLGLDLNPGLHDCSGEPQAKDAKTAAVRRADVGSPPGRIRVADYPELARAAWSVPGASTVSPSEALALYERGWRHLDAAGMAEHERELLAQLVSTVGNGHLLV